MPLARDPLSEWFDPAARRLLVRAYAAPRGTWVGVYVAPPDPVQRALAARLGIYGLYDTDRWGEARWVRAMKRSAYWNLKYYGRSSGIDFSSRRAAAGAQSRFAVAMEWQTGKRVLRAGWPSRRWAVRVRLHPGGQAAERAGMAAPGRWAGTGRASSASERDWG